MDRFQLIFFASVALTAISLLGAVAVAAISGPDPSPMMTGVYDACIKTFLLGAGSIIGGLSTGIH